MNTHQFVSRDYAYKIIAFAAVVFRKLNLIFYDCLDSHLLPDSLTYINANRFYELDTSC